MKERNLHLNILITMLNNLINKHFSRAWVSRLGPFLYSQEFVNILKTTIHNYKTTTCFPDMSNIFRMFRELDPQDIKVIIVNTEPYTERNEAIGIPLAVDNLPYIPPKLESIFNEIDRDFHYMPTDRTLTSWIKQGVFLLDISLTVEENKSESHLHLWKSFMKNFFIRMSELDSGIIYVFMGHHSQYFIRYVDTFLNYILTISDPLVDSYSNKKAFYGSNIFSKINKLLKTNNQWQIHF